MWACAEKIQLSGEELQEIGLRVFENECGGSESCLTWWNAGEDFASLGIGHFIWYPAGREGPFEEGFPRLIAFMKRCGVHIPVWVEDQACPWSDRDAFMEDFDSEKMQELRLFLSGTKDLQAEFLGKRLEEALPGMLAAADRDKRSRVRSQFYRVAGSPGGMYALVDYVNFKGEGTSPTERYQGQGWGLLQVLEQMDGPDRGIEAVEEFSRSAKTMLRIRVKNSPNDRGEERWLPGWEKRIDTYPAAARQAGSSA
ncbi:MAG TPA: hypothetical protein ENN34_12965 [Deltaproteobacteria bacterium]|nr:hypothetical protein [Deltaproteobacteria bacterium]